MFSFTEEIKREIISSPLEDRCCQLAALCAFIRTSGSVLVRDGRYGFGLVTENEGTAEFFCDLINSAFGITPTVADARCDVRSGRDKITFECVGDYAERALTEMGIIGSDADGKFVRFGTDERLTEKDCCKIAYIKGAFLGGGSCTLPEEGLYSRTGYHFEVAFSNRLTAGEFSDLLSAFDILAKCVTRKDSAVVYVKSKEIISDILNLISAPDCLEKLNKIAELKDKTNNENRVNNCSVSNIDKTVTASVNQVRAIEIIEETVGLHSLDTPLLSVAEARLQHKNASMSELARHLGLSKSCLNHRIRKLLDLAATLGRD